MSCIFLQVKANIDSEVAMVVGFDNGVDERLGTYSCIYIVEKSHRPFTMSEAEGVTL
jgi:hypothetical protein